MTKKLRKSDTLAVKDILEKLINIRAVILQIFEKTDSAQELNDLPHSLVPTDLLYEICICYEGMFDQLTEHKLLNLGHHRADRHIH